MCVRARYVCMYVSSSTLSSCPTSERKLVTQCSTCRGTSRSGVCDTSCSHRPGKGWLRLSCRELRKLAKCAGDEQGGRDEISPGWSSLLLTYYWITVECRLWELAEKTASLSSTRQDRILFDINLLRGLYAIVERANWRNIFFSNFAVIEIYFQRLTRFCIFNPHFFIYPTAFTEGCTFVPAILIFSHDKSFSCI